MNRKPKLILTHSKIYLSDFPESILRLVKHEMSVQIAEPGYRVFRGQENAFKARFWEGVVCLLKNGNELPSGLYRRVSRLLSKWGADFELEDRRIRPDEPLPRWSFPAHFALRDYQEHAVNLALEKGQGVIDSPPRTGKTIMIAEICRRISDLTVIVSPTIEIAKQTHQKLCELLGHAEEWSSLGDSHADFYLLTGGAPKNRLEEQAFKRAIVISSTINSALKLSSEFWEKVQCLIVDERHHQASESYRRLNDLAINAYWRFGFTGTNYRSSPSEHIFLEACLSDVIVSYSIKDMIAREVLVPSTVLFYPMDLPRRLSARGNFNALYTRGIVGCTERNYLIRDIAHDLLNQRYRVLILVDWIAHGKKLNDLITDSVFIKGASGDAIKGVLQDLDSGKVRCVIGSPVVGEGLDIPAADAVIYAKGLKAKVTHTQDIFRVLTAHGQKRRALIIDFCDRHQPALLEHASQRLKNYLLMGCEIKVLDNCRTFKVDPQLRLTR